MATVPEHTRRRHDNDVVAFVLSGGGNLGAVQVGMLRALLERGVRPDMLLGCSVGAINGAAFADDPTLAGLASLEETWIGLEGQNLLPSGWLPNAVSMARRGEAIHDHDVLRRMAEGVLGARTFEDLQLRFECVATDVQGVREAWFSSGELIEPLLASSALPAIYPAVEIDGVRYLDGGIVDDVPMSRAVELGATTIYVLLVGTFTRPRPEPRRPLDVAVQAYWVARHHRFKRELAAMPDSIEVHVLPTGETPRMRFNDFTQSRTLISAAHEASTAYLDDLAAGIPVGPPTWDTAFRSGDEDCRVLAGEGDDPRGASGPGPNGDGHRAATIGPEGHGARACDGEPDGDDRPSAVLADDREPWLGGAARILRWSATARSGPRSPTRSRPAALVAGRWRRHQADGDE